MTQAPSSAPRKCVTYSIALYRRLLRLYPIAFRCEFEAQMMLDFRDLCHQAQERGMLGIVSLWFRTLSDLISTAFVERLMEETSMDFLTDKDFETSAGFLAWLKEHPDGVVVNLKGSKMQLHLADCGHFKGADHLHWVRNAAYKGLSPNRSVLTERGSLNPTSKLAEWVKKLLGRELRENDWCTDCRRKWENEINAKYHYRQLAR